MLRIKNEISTRVSRYSIQILYFLIRIIENNIGNNEYFIKKN